MTTTKPCVVCGVDCTGRPRVKDPNGRYYCRPCYGSNVGDSPVFALPEASLDDARRERAVEPPIPRVTRALIAPSHPRAMKVMSIIAAMAMAFGTTPERLLTRKPQTLQAMEWSHVFMLGALGAVIGGLIYWWLGGRWFHVRLRWSGVKAFDVTQTRPMYFATVLPPGLWAASFALALPLWFATPTRYVDDFHPIPDVVMPIGMLVLLLLGCVAIFLMAWRGLGAKLVPSIIWFLVLPLVAYAAQIAAIFAIVMFGPAAPSHAPLSAGTSSRTLQQVVAARPAVDSPQAFAPMKTAPFSFQYPGNWKAEVIGPADGYRFATVQVSGPDGSFIMIDLLEGEALDAPTETIVEGVVEAVSEAEGLTVSHTFPLEGSGRFEDGTGQWVSGERYDTQWAIKVLVVARPEGRLLLTSLSPLTGSTFGHRGVAMVLDSLEVTAGP